MNMVFLFCFLIAVCSLPDCEKEIHLDQYRVSRRSEILISSEPKLICVIAPKTDALSILSLSFLPTRCVSYEEDNLPQIHPELKDMSLYKIKVVRNHCYRN